MANKGSYSLVAMLVLNPVLIVLYQNCSMSPVAGKPKINPPVLAQKEMASEGVQTKTVLSMKTSCAAIQDKDKNKSNDCKKTE